MKINTFVIIMYALACICIQANAEGLKGQTPNKDRIRPYSENPMYWQYKGEPVLLLGGSNDDNLFQWPAEKLVPHLDSMKAIGANYVRNTMSDRHDKGFELYPFKRLDNGKYDLGKWNEEYWQRFDLFLKETSKRSIIVQIEIWDRFDYSLNNWLPHPYNPKNNVNYSGKDSGLATEYPKHPYMDLQPFFHTIEGMPNYSSASKLLRKYQEKFVDKLLSYSLKHGNVLYCMNNETTTPSEWGKYWMVYIKDRAGEKQVYTTDMIDEFLMPSSCEACKQVIRNAEEYLFLDVSQINCNINQAHWDTLQWIITECSKYPIRPVNCVKTYGGENSSWGSGSNEDGVERFCRSVIGGCAAVRHHRPTYGNGLNEKATATIKSIRKVQSLVKMWDVEPHMELLSEREEDEAYLTAAEGSKYVLLFPEGGSVKIDLSKYNKKVFTGKWISIKTGEWGQTETITGGKKVKISTPDNGPWLLAVISLEK